MSDFSGYVQLPEPAVPGCTGCRRCPFLRGKGLRQERTSSPPEPSAWE